MAKKGDRIQVKLKSTESPQLHDEKQKKRCREAGVFDLSTHYTRKKN